MVVSQTQIDQGDATIRATWPAYTKYIHPDVFIGTAVLQPAAPAQQGVLVSVNVDGDSATSQPVPQSQVWMLTDIYTNSAADTQISTTIQFNKNKIKVLANTANIATQVVSNQTRPGLPGVLIYEPQSSMQLYAAPVAVNGASTLTNLFYVNATIYDSSFG